jgi:hypothetical protein
MQLGVDNRNITASYSVYLERATNYTIKGKEGVKAPIGEVSISVRSIFGFNFKTIHDVILSLDEPNI